MKGASCEHGAMTMGVARVAKTDAISPSALGPDCVITHLQFLDLQFGLADAV